MKDTRTVIDLLSEWKMIKEAIDYRKMIPEIRKELNRLNQNFTVTYGLKSEIDFTESIIIWWGRKMRPYSYPLAFAGEILKELKRIPSADKQDSAYLEQTILNVLSTLMNKVPKDMKLGRGKWKTKEQ